MYITLQCSESSRNLKISVIEFSQNITTVFHWNLASYSSPQNPLISPPNPPTQCPTKSRHSKKEKERHNKTDKRKYVQRAPRCPGFIGGSVWMWRVVNVWWSICGGLLIRPAHTRRLPHRFIWYIFFRSIKCRPLIIGEFSHQWQNDWLPGDPIDALGPGTVWLQKVDKIRHQRTSCNRSFVRIALLPNCLLDHQMPAAHTLLMPLQKWFETARLVLHVETITAIFVIVQPWWCCVVI